VLLVLVIVLVLVGGSVGRGGAAAGRVPLVLVSSFDVSAMFLSSFGTAML
jgi:hypothetical protein